jgi:hypothetical protein
MNARNKIYESARFNVPCGEHFAQMLPKASIQHLPAPQTRAFSNSR